MKRGGLIGASPQAIRQALEAEAQKEGFDLIGFTSAKAPALQGERLDQFLAEGRHGTMQWMEERKGRRADPASLWPEARTALCLGVNYGPDHDPRDNLNAQTKANISVYARGDDYHEVMKPRLKAIGRFIAEQTGAELKVFVDTAPVMEKPLAARAGLGWQGKHTNLVAKSHGSWLFLGVILTTLDLPLDEPMHDHCGSCIACLKACPTQAFPAPYQIDGRRCISYLTIEHHGPIPHEFRKSMGNRIYGCDDCLAACPWNKFAVEGRNMKLAARAILNAPSLSELAQLDDASFRALFAKNPVKRIGIDRFLRNVLIAIGNSQDLSLLPSAKIHLKHGNEVVREAAQWACAQLNSLTT